MPAALKLMDLNRRWSATNDPALREAIWREMLAIHADQQFGIGVLSEAPQPIVVSDRLRNVPPQGKWAWEPGSHFGVHRIDEFWFGDAPQDLAQVSE